MMTASSSAILKREIEAGLAARVPAALSPVARQAPRLVPCGVCSVDALLGGGVPMGGITEFSGLAGSGRTSLAFALLAEATSDAACAYIDVEDTVDPRCLAAAGVRTENLLWVRLTNPAAPMRVAAAAPAGLPEPNLRAMRGQRLGSRHPRTESRGVDAALGRMLRDKAEARSRKQEGTPGFPNRKLSLAEASSEQIHWEQCNKRDVDAADPIRVANQKAADEARRRTQSIGSDSAAIAPPSKATQGARNRSWTRLDEAIRAADQVLQSGGFRVVVLDLGSTPPEQAMRIPAATWFRFRRAAQQGDAILLLLTQAPCARSSALCVLECTVVAGGIQGNVLESLAYTAEVSRQRIGPAFGKKAPGRVAGWETTPAWMRAGGR